MTSSLPHDLDGLARHNARDRPRVARWSGCFFSLGHGAIVTLVLAGAKLPMGFGVAIIAVGSFAVAMRLARPTPA
jgi:hypothetical protein